MKILVVGAGAVGGYFGARLAQAGRDVSFLVRPERAELLRQRGLRIKSPYGDLKLPPALVTRESVAQPYDLVLVSVKSYALPQAMEDLSPGVGNQTLLLPVLNGMRHLDLLQARFGPDAVIGGTALIVADVDHERRIVQQGPLQRLTCGELRGGSSERIRAVERALSGAGFDVLVSSNIMQEMWEKWVQLASLGAMTCLLHGTIGEIAAARGGTDLANALVRECAAIATACSHPPSEQMLRAHLDSMTQAGSSLTSSMYRDMRRGASVEAEHILGDLHARGSSRGVEAPLLKAALVSLRVYEQGLARRV